MVKRKLRMRQTWMKNCSSFTSSFILQLKASLDPASPINRPSNESRSTVLSQEEVTLRQSPATDTVPLSSIPVESHEADPNVHNSTSQISSGIRREHGLSEKQTKEIDKAFKAFEKVLHTVGQKQLKDLLDGTILMNMVDTGGHPAFFEMLPALTMGPALYLIFFRLNQELRNTYKIQYVSKDREEVSLGDSSYTEPKENMPCPSHAAMLMGTHKDLLEGNPETVAKKK